MRRGRRAALVLVFAVLVSGGGHLAARAVVAGEPPPLVLFYGEGCPHCAAERSFLGDLVAEFPDLVVEAHEVWYDEEGRRLFLTMAASYGIQPRAVPTTFFGDRVWVGFDEGVAPELRAAVAAAFGSEAAVAERAVRVPLFGEVDVDRASLVLSTLAIGFVDGFNPCSLWVLSLLLALVLHGGSRRRVMAVGVVFLVVTTLLYGLYMAGLYGVLSYVSHLAWIRAGMALVALAFGVVNVKDFFWFRRGISLTIPESRRPGIYRRVREVARGQGSLPATLLGAGALAVGVSLVETPCTAGFPVLWVDLLAARGVGAATAVGLFGLYMLVFLADELAVLGTAVVAMRASRLGERQGRFLKLVSGWVMVVLAVMLVAAPASMESVAGVLMSFGAAVMLSAASVPVDRLLRRRARAG